MKKPYKNTELAVKRCEECNRPLKKNLIFRRLNANLCYHCFYPKEMKRRGINVTAS